MTKKEAINIINSHLVGIRILNGINTHFSNIIEAANNDKKVWWTNIPPEKFDQDLHLLFNRQDGFFWIKISANTITPAAVFRIREDNGKVDIEASSNKHDRYMRDIKSGGAGYDFRPHIQVVKNEPRILADDSP
ncbi:MAG: hypothetical protein HAW59_03245 [Betaproteobacteria bacterium]|nr:hypothetical protein [Betaproteobacteria bacterium]